VRAVLTETEVYTRYYIDYPSDDLTITGVMQVPHGEGPFPVVILNHGYIPPSRFWSGADTWRAADYLVSHGYLTIAPDFRGWGQSDRGSNYFRTGLVIDVLNLFRSLFVLIRRL
ncbi:MAG: peptidase, partial [Chloroflexi bacterium]|nr:peptidase [Chloroflexota bacterium]